MNPVAIFKTLEANAVRYLVLGGFNFLLGHRPILTFDIDLWIEDTADNRVALVQSLIALGAAWGPTEETWEPVRPDAEWLLTQPLFCLTTRQGALDVFREVRGLEGRWAECRSQAVQRKGADFEFFGLSDEHMLECQLALDPGDRKLDRIAILTEAIQKRRRLDSGGKIL